MRSYSINRCCKKKWRFSLHLFYPTVMKRPHSFLETDNRPKGRLQIVVGVVVEIHFVSDIQTQSNGPEMSFKTAAGIEGAGDVGFAQTGDRASERPKCRGRIIQAEIDKPAFRGNKRLNGVSTQ